MILVLLAAFLVAARFAFSGRPVMVTGATLTLLFGIGLVGDAARNIATDRDGSGPLIALAVLVALYPLTRKMAVVGRARSAVLSEALARSARMIRVRVEGGPRSYRTLGVEPAATVTVAALPGRLHAVVFGGNWRSPKVRLLRKVLQKQFGRLVPILIRLRS